MRALAVSFVLLVACNSEPAPKAPPSAQEALDPDQEAYVADIMAFTKTTRDQVRARMKKGSVPLKEEWEAWEQKGPMTEARMSEFYKQTTNYMYELGEWHLFVPGKRASDLQLVKDIMALSPKNVLDFGGGVGLNALMLARAGLDVTIADLESTSLDFAQFRATRHKLNLKVWKTDLQPAPPDAKYDVILALDVLEHLPKEVLEDLVNKLVKLKHDKTRVIMSAPFGRTSVHPMHLDSTDHTKQQVERLLKELPPS